MKRCLQIRELTNLCRGSFELHILRFLIVREAFSQIIQITFNPI